MEATRGATLGAVVGENLARLRASRRQTQTEAAAFLREHGLSWSSANVAQIESGRRQNLTVTDLVMLSDAYKVQPAEWFAGKGSIQIAEHVRITREELRQALAGGDFTVMLDAHQRARRYVGSEPARAASLQLRRPVEEVEAAAADLWRRSVQDERDQRVGDVADRPMRSVQALRGQVTRALVAELRSHFEAQEGRA